MKQSLKSRQGRHLTLLAVTRPRRADRVERATCARIDYRRPSSAAVRRRDSASSTSGSTDQQRIPKPH